MGKAKKSTKKFNKNHLKGELERRHKHKKNQQLFKKREIKKNRKSGSGLDDEEKEVFTGIEEVDGLTEFAESTPKGVGANMDISKFMEADPNNNDVSDEEDISALLGDGSDLGSDDEDDLSSGSDSGSELEEDEDENEDDEEAEDNEDDEDIDSDEEEVFKQQLGAMKAKDPQFFDDEEDEEEEDEGDDNDDDDVEMSDAESSAKSTAVSVTTKMLDIWVKEIKNDNSLKSLKKLLLAFYSASHMESENDSTSNTPYRIEGVRVFNKTVSSAIRMAPTAFGHYAPVVKGKLSRKASGNKWHPLELLKQMSDPEMIQYLIKESERMIPYFACFDRYTRDLVKEMLRQFGSPTADDAGVAVGSDVTDMALKGIYLTYVRHSNVKNVASLTTIQLMRNCGVELYGNDAKASYQHAFVYIRQLAIHLRNSMQLRSKESFRAIYNWQFINSLSFWTEVLATYCGDRAEEQPEFCAILESLSRRAAEAPKEYEHTRVYLEVVLDNAFGLLADAIASQSVRIAFPEWVVPAVLQLKRWRKRAGQSWSKFSKQLQGLLEKVEQSSRMVQQHRSKVDFGPANSRALTSS
ncbi:Noc2p family-domain-containing protein [Kickxella alabastrina]|uniref:Noc2p family-domain-containing protein n=1 Tax=Kickxella alabastrina TaxID=61397 RepID=UPI00221F7ECC|nr:Noc2p family-domain-containing protein [Kickxella alabastrina]KAI7827843.1 Noc2p family-domain-containing protein [Kickxella alabastrina]